MDFCFDFNDFKIILEKLISGEYNLRQISNNARLLADKNKWSNVINEWEKLFMKLLIENLRDKIYWFRVRNRLSNF